MKKSVVFILLYGLIILQSHGQPAQGKQKKLPKPPAVFSVNGNSVTADEFIYLYKKNHQNKSTDFTTEKIQEYLDLYINFKLKVEEAHQRGMDTTASFRKEYNSYKEELRKPYLPDTRLTDSLVRLTYQRMQEEVRASNILINVKPEASPADTLVAYNKIMEIKNKALAGQDFGLLAVDYSEDPTAKANKGNLGYFTAMQMVFPFETAAYSGKVGSVVGPVRTRFGYHLIQVTDRRPARGEVEVSHIMIRTGDGKDAEKAKNSIFDIYDELRGGVKWEELCKQFSDDPGSKDNGGRLRPFGVRTMAAVPEFEQVAFALQNSGDISDPFQTQYGWHIVRLEKKIPLPPFEEIETSLKARVNRDERTQVSKQALQAKQRKEFNLVENEVIKTKVLTAGDSSLRKGKWRVPLALSSSKEVLFTLQAKGYVVKDFILYAQKNQRSNTLSPEKYMEQLYNKYVDDSIMELFEARIIQNNPEYKFLLKEYHEGILLFEIMEKEVWNKATEDSIGQRNYYSTNRASYQAKERAKAALFSTSSKDFQRSLMELIEKGDSVKIKEFVTEHKIRQESGVFEKEEKQALVQVPWSNGLYLSENNGMYYLAWIFDILPPATKTFEEARATVISDYQNALEKNWLAGLRKKYPVKINEKGKHYILASLQKA